MAKARRFSTISSAALREEGSISCKYFRYDVELKYFLKNGVNNYRVIVSKYGVILCQKDSIEYSEITYSVSQVRELYPIELIDHYVECVGLKPKCNGGELIPDIKELIHLYDSVIHYSGGVLKPREKLLDVVPSFYCWHSKDVRGVYGCRVALRFPSGVVEVRLPLRKDKSLQIIHNSLKYFICQHFPSYSQTLLAEKILAAPSNIIEKNKLESLLALPVKSAL